MENSQTASLGYLRFNRASTGNEKGREALLLAAEQAFYTHGYHGTSTRQITRDAGVTVAAMYYYYPSKQELLFDLMERFMVWSLSSTTEVIEEAADDPVSRLSAMVRSHVHQHATHRIPSFVVNNEIRSLTGDNRTRIVELRDRIQALFNSAVLDGQKEGLFTTAHPREASRGLVTMATAVASWYRPEGVMTPEELCECYVDIALDTVGFRGTK